MTPRSPKAQTPPPPGSFPFEGGQPTAVPLPPLIQIFPLLLLPQFSAWTSPATPRSQSPVTSPSASCSSTSIHPPCRQIHAEAARSTASYLACRREEEDQEERPFSPVQQPAFPRCLLPTRRRLLPGSLLVRPSPSPSLPPPLFSPFSFHLTERSHRTAADDEEQHGLGGQTGTQSWSLSTY